MGVFTMATMQDKTSKKRKEPLVVDDWPADDLWPFLADRPFGHLEQSYHKAVAEALKC